MNDKQRAMIKRFDEAWVVDTNMAGEPIVYTRSGADSGTVQEYVIDVDGKATAFGTYPFTVKLQKELNLLKKGV